MTLTLVDWVSLYLLPQLLLTRYLATPLPLPRHSATPLPRGTLAGRCSQRVQTARGIPGLSHSNLLSTYWSVPECSRIFQNYARIESN